MFLRKIKDDNNIDSLDRIIVQDNDGSEVKLEDKISDDSNLIEDYEKLELHKIIRNLVKQLPKRDKEIVILYFGFYNDKIYTQQEIADKLDITQRRVSQIIIRIVKDLREKLREMGVIELHFKQDEYGKENNKMRNLQTIYQYFKDYTKEQIDEMIKNLTDEDKELLELRYGKDLNNPTSTELNQLQRNNFYGVLIPKMKKKLANPNYEPKPRGRNPKQETTSPTTNLETNNMTKDDCTKMLELLRKPTFGEMINVLSIKEAIIIALKLGYLDGKYFSTKAIAEFLEIDEEEVREITKKILLVHKENINTFLDIVIEKATNPDDQSNTSAVKVIKNS